MDNRSNYEKVEVSNGASTISIADVGLVDPQKSMRNLLIKHVSNQLISLTSRELRTALWLDFHCLYSFPIN